MENDCLLMMMIMIIIHKTCTCEDEEEEEEEKEEKILFITFPWIKENERESVKAKIEI